MFNKRSKIFPLILAVLLLIGAVDTAQAASAGLSQVGVVDYLYLLNNHPDTPKANEALRAEQEKAKTEFSDKSTDLSDKEKQNLDRQLGQRLEQKQLELLKPIAESVNAAMRAVADDKNLTVVVYKNSVALGGMDITEDVLKKLKGK